ncbi:MAG: deoxyguanosinetriphosphate triphosphohydrolase [Atopobium sp.]|uniref:deoxyguanosinetriphosphate triphosphohydrolase n=1 Tax=Atopobium sp. TaxID=1872650 RepID=UPI002A8138E8|nr:deoxyguanosinetriphosphate triphosphohydrolase [Atopobium sp.]MDY4522125.1 deoxyguanosinetriphosphate triphosphohydrolase [Atopobium sp.]
MSHQTQLAYREVLEQREHDILSPYAAFSDETVGRLHEEEADVYRTNFQCDRDRILHCKSFRRLAHKTQVFLAPEGDHYRTRLTHSLEVTQIARDIARPLRLNEDLTEAIGLGHDLGHTPFGHTGERTLSKALAEIHQQSIDQVGMTQESLIFKHNEQSARIVDFLEKNGKGLNLTREVVDGIVCHTGKQKAMTLEGQIVALADRIAYVSHDIDDATRAGLLTEDDLPYGPRQVLGHSSSQRIATMVEDVIATSQNSDTIRMSPKVFEAMMDLRSFLNDNIYTKSDAKVEEPKANQLIYVLFFYFVQHMEAIPAEYRIHDQDKPEIQVADFIAGMTDRYAIRTFQNLMVPRAWRMGGSL